MLIEEYFKKIEADIANFPSVIESRLVKDKRSLHIGIIEGQIYFVDGSVLFFIEFVNVKERMEKYKYSYHYQDQDGKFVFRYDMAPHHRGITSFPHHKHIESKKVIEASEPSVAKILDEIEGLMV